MSDTVLKMNGGITTILFDVDDTLYDVSCGFTAHRNGYGALQFMVDILNFPNIDNAKIIRDEYFQKYHSTAKALMIAEKDGKFPIITTNGNNKLPRFNPQDLAEFWATKLNFTLLGGKKVQLINDLLECKLNLIAFSNGPRKYVKRVLIELDLWDNVFNDNTLFAVDDVLPYCKPDKEAFDIIFNKLNIKPNECIIIEDSMKNIRKAKELGITTVLVAGLGKLNGLSISNSSALESEATKAGDAPILNDPSVDVVIETIEDLRKTLPVLWNDPPIYMSLPESIL